MRSASWHRRGTEAVLPVLVRFGVKGGAGNEAVTAKGPTALSALPPNQMGAFHQTTEQGGGYLPGARVSGGRAIQQDFQRVQVAGRNLGPVGEIPELDGFLK